VSIIGNVRTLNFIDKLNLVLFYLNSFCHRAKAKYAVRTLVLIQEELTKEEK